MSISETYFFIIALRADTFKWIKYPLIHFLALFLLFQHFRSLLLRPGTGMRSTAPLAVCRCTFPLLVFYFLCYGGLALLLRIRLLREARNDGKYGHCEGADLILFEFRSPRQHPWQSVVSRIQPSFSTAFISTKDLRFRSGSGCSLRQAQGPMMGFFIPALNQVSSMQKC